MSNAPKPSRRDRLITTTDDGRIELTEEELSRATGGTGKKAAAGGAGRIFLTLDDLKGESTD